MENSKPRALDGLRVLDLSRILAGPYCTMMLADHGAEVIKVEHPVQGDGTRQWGPPWQYGESAYYLSVNRNKKSIALDIKSDNGKNILWKLLETCDVLIENFRVGTMQSMGMDYETISAIYPGLVYCSITGYGQDGPDAHRPGYDFAIQAESGLMSITGPENGEPHKVGVAITDITAGLHAFGAILAALRVRDQTGRGQYIDVALMDVQLSWLANVAQNHLCTGNDPKRYGNGHPNIVPYQSFNTESQPIALAVGTDPQYHKLCRILDRMDLWDDIRFQSNAGRVGHRDVLVPRLQETIQEKSCQHWLQLCHQHGIPASPVQTIPEALQTPQALHRHSVISVRNDAGDDLRLLSPVPKMSMTPPRVTSFPPKLGEHGDQILEHIGWIKDCKE